VTPPKEDPNAPLPPDTPRRANPTGPDAGSGPAGPAPTNNTPPSQAPSAVRDAWTLAGTVYDLRTLKPCPKVALLFSNKYNGDARTRTDARGRYRIVLHHSPSGVIIRYDAFAEDRRYARAVLHEPDIPYASLSAPERADLIEAARTGDLHGTTIDEPNGPVEIRLDLFLAPEDSAR
jgi:hypothetical protein